MTTPVSVRSVAEVHGTCDKRGGCKDAKKTEPWEQDTITNVWSTTKAMVGLSALILADRGDLDLDAPVARYWPEFAAAGKEQVLVRHLLSHTAGLPEFDPPVAVADLYDWRGATTRLARQAPRWEPGTLAGYHSVAQGFLVGEVVRRITGQSLAAPPGDQGATTGWIRVSDGNSVAWRRAEILSGSGYGNARSVAAVQSVLACGGEARGIRLLSPGGWAGWGGSIVMVDLDARMTAAYVMNQMLQPDYRGLGIVLAAYDALG